jgi:STE24 endopeptidase
VKPRRTAPVEIPGLDVAKAKRYSRTRLAALIASTVWTALGLIWFAVDRRASRLHGAIGRRVPDRRWAGPLFIAAASAFAWLSHLPAAYFGGYLVERRFELSKQPLRGWLADQIKALVVSTAVQTPLLSAAFVVIRRRPSDWWLVLSAAAVPLTVLLSNLAPVLLMPLFNRFVPLRDGALAARIRALGDRGGVRISDVYEMDMSRQSERPNALFTGLGNSKRIVLGDTLLERFADDEIEAVVAHELGHQVHADIWRFIAFGAGSGFALAWILSRTAPEVVKRTSDRTGVASVGDEASLPVLALLATIIGIVLMPIQAAFSRALEQRADRFAIELTRDGEAYARAMERLAALSLADPDPPPAVVFMLYSHPPIAERIRVARAAVRVMVAVNVAATASAKRG